MNKSQAVDEFVARVNYLHDSNYGDFKRKVDTAMTRLWEVLGHDSKEIDNLLYSTKKKIVFEIGCDNETARHLAIDTADKIKSLI